jgi:hypothetical protein
MSFEEANPVTREPLDPRIDRMIASLYGELSGAEEIEFQRLLTEDPELRSEYEELRGTRAHMKGWKIERTAPSFVMLEKERSAFSGGLRARFARGFRALSGPSGWALAGAAAALFGLFLAGARVERFDGGVALRFGAPERPVELAQPLGPPEGLETKRPSEPGLVPASVAPYVTREELQTYNDQLMRSLVILLNEYSDRHEGDVAGLVRAVYDQMSIQQSYDYQELAHRLEALGTEMLLEKSRRAVSPTLEELLARRLGPGAREPRELTPSRDREE